MRRAIAILALTAPTLAGADELQVGPGGYTSIQAAVDAAQTGDVITIADGTYVESVVIDRVDLTGLTLRATHGGAVTLSGSNTTAHTIDAVDCDLTLRGLRVVAPNPQHSAPRAIRVQTLAAGEARALAVCDSILEQGEVHDGMGITCDIDGGAPIAVAAVNTTFAGFDSDLDQVCMGYTDGWDWIDTVCTALTL